jgi:peptide/nickel transport system substrate-binding protein
MKPKIFPIFAVLTIISMIIVSCAPASVATPAVIEKEVTKIVPQTIIQTVQVTAVPLPANTACPFKGGTLVVGIDQPPQQMNPLTTGWMTEATGAIYETLVTRDPKDGSYKDGLAESWETSQDGLTWTFHLRKGVTFSDKTVFNADAVKFFFDEAKKPTYLFGWFFTNLDSAEVKDDYTIVLHLKSPIPDLLHSLSTLYASMVSPTAVQKLGDRYGVDDVVGTGPFVFKSWGGGDVVTVVRREDYNWAPSWAWNKGPACLDAIEFRTIPDATARTAALEAGDIQLISSLPGSDVTRELKNPNLTVRIVPGWNARYVAMITTNPPLDDVKVRQALYHSFDRDATIQAVWRGYADPMYSYVPSNMPGALTGIEDLTSYDPAQAEKLFAEAGYTKGPDGILQKGGKKLSLRIITANDSEARSWGPALQAQLKTVGVDTTVTALDTNARDAALKAGEGDLFPTLYVWDSISILQFFFSSANIPMPNFSRVNDPKVDDLIKQILNNKTEDDMFKAGYDLQKYLLDLAAWIPVANLPSIWAWRNEVGGFYPSVPQSGSEYPWLGGIYLHTQ